MIAKVKRLNSPDVINLEEFTPTRSESFGLLIEVFIGVSGEIWEEQFQIYVCTPLWLAENFANVSRHFNSDNFLSGSGYFFVKSYDYADMHQQIHKTFDAVSGENWQEIAQKLSKISWWEFDDCPFNRSCTSKND
jgi:hypothetical protein